jgi:predicted metal-dependent hydrolase
MAGVGEGAGPERDRDTAGRPRNARPRDGLGRPLPRGEAGSERVPEDLVLPPADSLAEAQRLLDAGRPFHAHEVLEGTWKAAPAAERDLWQGLAQLAVGLTHVLRGNPTGAAALLRRGRDRVATYRSAPPYRIDVPGLLAWADGLLADLADLADPADRADRADRVERPDRADRADLTHRAERADPADPADRADRVDPAALAYPADPAGHIAPVVPRLRTPPR